MRTYTHSEAFLDALGINSPDCMYYIDGVKSHGPASRCVEAFIYEIQRPSLVGTDRLPAWVSAPGSPEGLAALRAIMEALRYDHEEEDGEHWFGTIDGQLTIVVSATQWDVSLPEWRAFKSPWTDPTALPRLLHLAVALAPGEVA